MKEWDKDFPAMTRYELEHKREEFWETRIQGRVEVWNAIKLALEAEDEATKRVVMEAAGLSAFQQDKATSYFCYDSLGMRYDIPFYLTHEPRNLVTARVPQPGSTSGDEIDDAAKINDVLKFTIRLSNAQGDMVVEMTKGETIKQLKDLVEEHKDITVDRQRVLYQGRRLNDELTLGKCRILPDTVIQVAVAPASNPEKK